jgi:hypothetical protein
MQTAKIPVYEYEELSKEAKAKVISHFQKIEEHSSLSEDLTYSVKELLNENKIENVSPLRFKVHYSLSYCQGDGLCFVGAFKWHGYNVMITHSGRYVHSNSVTIGIETRFGNDAKKEVYEEFKKLYDSICKKAEKQGYEIIEYDNSEEAIKNTIETNDYRFLSDGTLFAGKAFDEAEIV